MLRSRQKFAAVVAAGCMLTAIVVWQAVHAGDPGDSPREAPPVAGPDKAGLLKQLGGADRYILAVSTDKPMYKPGETLRMRAVILHHATRKPLPEDKQTGVSMTVTGPKGDVVAGGQGVTVGSAAGLSWEIPKSTPGGQYTLKCTTPEGYAPAERTFDIRVYRAPRLRSQIKFLRDGYGPGDEVTATLETTRAEGGVPAGAAVTVIARVDGAEVHRGRTTVDEQGRCVAKFPLPDQIARGEGVLSLVIEDGGVVETASKTLPILLQTVDLSMYPEGGELIAGLENRVYFEAFTPAAKPADLAGDVVDQEGKSVATFRSEHEGRGRFVFTPAAGEKYFLKITQPAGIKTQYPLPEVLKEGGLLRSTADVYPADAPIQLQVAAQGMKSGVVTLSQRENQIAKATVDLTKEAATVSLSPADASSGVLIATLWDSTGKKPLAERLIFRESASQVRISIEPSSQQYTPGSTASLKIRTVDEKGKPVSAMVGLNVTDDSVLEMVDRREQAPSLPVMLLLEGEVRNLADAHVYLDRQNPEAPVALDLLLGVQGWRKFAYVNMADFLGRHGDGARRALALRMQSVSERRELLMLDGIVEELEFAAQDKAAAVVDRDVDGEVELAKEAAPVAENKPADAPLAPKNEPAAIAAQPAPVAREPAPEPAAFGAARPAKPLPPLEKEQRQLRKKLAEFQDRANRRRIAGNQVAQVRRDDFVAVRIYAHEVRAGRQAGERVDFTETLFWHAGLKTDAKGEATVEFGLNDSVTSFKVQADAFSAAGALGAGSVKIESVEPFYLEPKLPLEVTAGDQVDLPVAVVNATDAALAGGQLTVTAGSEFQLATGQLPVALAAGERGRKLVRLTAQPHNGPAALTLRGSAGPYADSVTRSVTVVPRGFPIEDGRGGLISPGDLVTQEIIVPEDYVAGSMKSRVVVYPTPLASMNEALARLIREPYGCFEQTSSSTYPLVMAQQYFKSHQGVDPAMIERSAALLDKGYNRLIGFECKSGGFEWFGADPGHDALTAYGLLEFTDMAKVSHVDTAMLDRTRKWLLSQRDGKGGYKRQTHTLHTWLAEPEVQYTYDTWALLEAGVDADMSREVKWVRDTAEKTQNTYVMALAANVLGRAGDKDGENHMLDKLAGKQQEDGSLSGATVSVVGSGGDALKVETTALAVSAWLNNPSYAANVEKSIQFLAETCKAGRFGSTQSTVLALRAIVAYDASRAKPKAPGTLQLLVDGEPVGKPVAFTADTKGAIELPAIDTLLSPGSHKVQVQMTGGSQMPYSIAVDYHREQPVTSEACKLHMQVKLTETKLVEGGATEAMVTVVNRTNEDLPTPTAIVGIPGGLEVRHDQLKELVKAGKIAAYEVLGREVVLYWRTLAKEERTSFPLSLVAAIPGQYTAPASRAYLYYTDEHKHWTPALTAEITAR